MVARVAWDDKELFESDIFDQQCISAVNENVIKLIMVNVKQGGKKIVNQETRELLPMLKAPYHDSFN